MSHRLAEVGLQLKRIRKQIGLSRRVFAEKCNVSETAIKNWETGNKEIGILKLAKCLAVFQEHGVYIDFNSIMHIGPTPILRVELNKLQELEKYLKQEASSALFYTQPDGWILYFNPLYRNIISKEKITLLHLENIFKARYVKEILATGSEKKIVNITHSVQHSIIQLELELKPELDINNCIIGIAGFLLSNTIISN